MFVQVIRGQVSDVDGFRAAIERWVRDLSPGAPGWLGSTRGVTENGEMIALVRFDSADSARASSDRSEQGEWWAETSKLLTGEATFRETDQVDVDLHGNPDEAGFVQVMEGRTRDPQRARELMAERPDEWASYRPDVISSTTALFDDGAFTMAIYFTSEEAAREGETKEPPEELRAAMEEMNSLGEGTPAFFDLRDPWMHSPG